MTVPKPDLPVLLVAATALELVPLAEAISERERLELGRSGLVAWRGRIDGHAVVLLETGVGKSNAASALAVALETIHPVSGVIGLGIAGAYPGAHLRSGDAVLACEEIFADEGSWTRDGFVGCDAMGFSAHRLETRSNRISIDPGLVERAEAILAEERISITTGALATVSTCSGNDASAEELRRRTRALGESMEGAAWAAIAQQYRVPFLELRGISNVVGDRDRSSWNVEGAAWACAHSVRVLLGVFSQPGPRLAPLVLGLSPCPNDTFVFHAFIQGLVEGGSAASVESHFCDIDELNRGATARLFDVVKVSCGAIPWLLDDYALLRSGGAVGRGCGPLLVSREPCAIGDLRGQPIAIPGQRTTAHLLLRLRDAGLGPFQVMPFAEILRAVSTGQTAAGLIIHESRFTYSAHGLRLVCDLGDWWQKETGLPIPLGAILGRRKLGKTRLGQIERGIARSAVWALEHPSQTRPFVREHAQEIDDAVIDAHIALYVNSFTVDLGEEGVSAVRALLDRAANAGLTPRRAADDLF